MIDIHTHVIPPEVPFGAKPEKDWPSLELDDGCGHFRVPGGNPRSIDAAAWILERRRADMEEHGVSRQALSPISGLISYAGPPATLRDYCRGMNEWIAAAVATDPEHFMGIGILPMTDPDMAASMMPEIAQLGLVGVEIGSSIHEFTAGDRRFDGVYAEAERLNLSVFIHAFGAPRFEAFTPSMVATAVVYPSDIATAGLALIANGFLERYPRLRVALSHGGGGLPFVLPRFVHLWENYEAVNATLPRSPLHYAKKLFVDSIFFDAAPLKYTLDYLGLDSVVIGSDYPILDRPPGWWVQESDLDNATKRHIFVANGLRYFGLDGKSL